MAGAVAVLVAASAVGTLLVAGMTFDPEVARSDEALECRDVNGFTLCTWPEHAANAGEVAEIAARARARWEQSGIAAPRVFTEADEELAPPGSLVFDSIDHRATRDEVVRLMAKGLLPAFPDCAGGATGGIAFEYLEAWYASTGGMTSDGLLLHYDFDTEPLPRILTVVEHLDAATLEVRQAWISRAEAITQSCEDWPPELLAVEP